MVRAADILGDELDVLRRAHRGKSESRRPRFLTSLQILDRLPDTIRNRLILEKGGDGARAGRVVRRALVMLHRNGQVEESPVGLDSRGATFDVAGRQTAYGYPDCRLYRYVSQVRRR